MLELLKYSKLVLTDSGGLQKETFFIGKNRVTLRDQTEWTELIENGFNVLTGSNEKQIVNAVDNMLLKVNDFNINLYGQCNTSEIIADGCKNGWMWAKLK